MTTSTSSEFGAVIRSNGHNTDADKWEQAQYDEGQAAYHAGIEFSFARTGRWQAGWMDAADAYVAEADFSEKMFDYYDDERCTCTPISDGCPACIEYNRRTLGDSIPY